MASASSEIAKWRKAVTKLQEVGAIQFGEFTLTSGKTSPYYIDLRLTPSYPQIFKMLRDLCLDIIRKEIGKVEKLAGVLTGGLPLATAVSSELGSPLIFVRKRRKSHGGGKLVEGILNPEEDVVLIDDVATTGGSLKKAAEDVRAEEGRVEHAVVVIDRGEGARDKLEDCGVELHACMKIEEVMKYLHGVGSIGKKRLSSIVKYLKKRSKSK